MASKSARKEPATPAAPPKASPSGTRSSPLSPTRASRLQEKSELQNLNNRLASYIDRVRHLENENNKLMLRVQTTEESRSLEISSVKDMYAKELDNLRAVADELSRDKAKLEIDTKRLFEENDLLKQRLVAPI